MVRTVGWTRGSSRWFAGIAAAAQIVGGAASASAQESGAPDQAVGVLAPAATDGAMAGAGTDEDRRLIRTHVRGVDAAASALLETGRSRSATFRRLVETLESSDVVVYVGRGPRTAPADLRFVSASTYGRHLRITLNVAQDEAKLLALLGHELQHAVEVASAPSIADAAAMKKYYEAHGVVGVRGGLCTRAAQETTASVAWEVGASRPRK